MSEVEYIPATVNLTTNPELATTQAEEAGVQLLKLLDKKEHPVIINKKRHIEFEDWVTLGNFYGVTVKTGDPKPIEIFESKGFEASAEVIRVDDGIVIGGASAYCLNNEKNWKNKDYFQMASMAQTRAGSKALSNVLRWVVALSGISGTPAEEMAGIKGKNEVKRGVRPGTKTRPNPDDQILDEVNNIVDAEIVEKKGSKPGGKDTKMTKAQREYEGEPSGELPNGPSDLENKTVHDMVPLWEKCLQIENKEWKQIINSFDNKDEHWTKNELIKRAASLTKAKRMKNTEYDEIKELVGALN